MLKKTDKVIIIILIIIIIIIITIINKVIFENNYLKWNTNLR
jgi:uncharacterized integral membrane protein